MFAHCLNYPEKNTFCGAQKRVSKAFNIFENNDLIRVTVLRIQLILMRIRFQIISLKFTKFFKQSKFFIFCLFSLIFMLKLDKPFRNQEIFIISLFSIVQIWILRVFFFSFSFWIRIR